MSGLTELPKGAEGLADAFLRSDPGEWRELFTVAGRMGYNAPDPAGCLPNMTHRLVGAGHPTISITMDGTGEGIAGAIVMP